MNESIAKPMIDLKLRVSRKDLGTDFKLMLRGKNCVKAGMLEWKE